MKRYYAKVNGREYKVEIEELAAGAAAPRPALSLIHI